MLLSVEQELFICYTKPLEGLGGFVVKLGGHKGRGAEGDMFRLMVVKRDVFKSSGMGPRPMGPRPPFAPTFWCLEPQAPGRKNQIALLRMMQRSIFNGLAALVADWSWSGWPAHRQ